MISLFRLLYINSIVIFNRLEQRVLVLRNLNFLHLVASSLLVCVTYLIPFNCWCWFTIQNSWRHVDKIRKDDFYWSNQMEIQFDNNGQPQSMYVSRTVKELFKEASTFLKWMEVLDPRVSNLFYFFLDLLRDMIIWTVTWVSEIKLARWVHKV